jgi:stage II sporulation protein D
MKLWRLYCALLIAASCVAQDDGGRNVSVALFSTHTVKSVVITPLDANAWRAHCATCPHEAFAHPLIVAGSMDVFAGGSLRVTEETSHSSRSATGLWHFRANAAGSAVDVVLTLPSERYVAAVLNAEASPNEPPQSLQALAIVVRTYALNGKHYTAQPGHLAADLCDSTACQAMLLQPSSQIIDDAAQQTAGETLWFGARRADVFFSQSCGGLTEDADSIWPALRSRPYLQSHTDPYCLRRSRDAWNAQVPLQALAAIAKAEGWHLPADIVAARVTQQSSSHRALRIEFSGRNGETALVSASALRFGIGRALGWNQVRSDAYELGVRNGALVFDGRGHGHGVGLCQTGAEEMAAEGKSTREILAFYFPGTAIRITPLDDGWHEVHADSLTIRAAKQPSAAQQAKLEDFWTEAQKRFPPHHALTATLIFAPTSELFRQLTSQPGWMLAETQGNVVILQPEVVLRAKQRNETATLLHEMLHVAVEAECSAKTPLWLREGLVEVLSGDSTGAPASMSSQAMEAELLHPSSLQANERAHHAAGAKVKGLIARYGVSVVRGWLASGPPAGVA